MRQPTMGVLLALLCSAVPGLCHLATFYGVEGALPPLAVISDHPLSVGRTVVRVPLIAVPQGQMNTIDGVHISAVSSTEPLVTCKLQQYTVEATPAVRVVLDEPLLLGGPEALVGFPAQLSVAHAGLRISLPVGALLAPVPSPSTPNIVRVLYAIPTSPIYLRYPYFPSLQASPFFPTFRPDRNELTSGALGLGLGEKKPPRPLVTVLDFPSELESPPSLYYQPAVESELGNRGPPEGVVPAGVVQSAQPRPHLTPFINSKESPFLQTLRDEAEKNRLKSSSRHPAVEAL